MSYEDIIRDNCARRSPVSWWPKFAYHFTDVENAVSILRSGYLYSRASAQEHKLMRNDNASRQVIDMTKTEAISSVRFYFRPLTPTQYYNEGYKHPQLRYDNDSNANIPVPVFFLFDLSKLLSLPGVRFSELPQSGYGAELKSGLDSFSTLPFERIYSTGFENFDENKRFRHAEILYPNSMPLDSCLHSILCRNSLERITLLSILKACDNKKFIIYQKLVKVCREDMFENNGLFLTECRYHGNVISISFSDSYPKQQYIQRMMQKNSITSLKPIGVRLELNWLNGRSVLRHNVTETQIDYQNSSSIVFQGVPTVPNAKILRMQVYVEQKLMCCVEQSLDESELIR